MIPKALDFKTLNRQYHETIDRFEARLDELEAVFNSRCEKIRKAAHAKLAVLPKSDRAGRGEVLAQEKKELDQALRDLKISIKKNSREMRKKLEEIQTQKDALEGHLDSEPNAR